VEARHIFVHPNWFPDLGERFKVRLAFNYSLIPGTEFELIELTSGSSIQLLQHNHLSHMGFHTARDQPDDGTIDSLLEELQQLQKLGCEILQVSQTIEHSNTARRYRYGFVSGAATGGVLVKVIQRIIPVKPSKTAKSLAEGRELFACLTP
jgi:hypothetical protein